MSSNAPQQSNAHARRTSTEVAALFSVTNDYVSQLCRKRKVVGVLVAGEWMVEPESVRAYLDAGRARTAARYKQLSAHLRAQSAPAPASLTSKLTRGLAPVLPLVQKKIPKNSKTFRMVEPSLALAVLVCMLVGGTVTAYPISKADSQESVASAGTAWSIFITWLAGEPASEPVVSVTQGTAVFPVSAVRSTNMVVNNKYYLDERTLEQVVPTTSSSWVTYEFLNAQVDRILGHIADDDSGGSSVENLSAGDIPDLSDTYLALTGGTLTGALVSSASASSSLANGINISAGCFSVAGVCVTGGGGVGAWGSVTGTLSNQSDLQAALDAKLATSAFGPSFNAALSATTTLPTLTTLPGVTTLGSLTGILKATGGVLTTAVVGVDYLTSASIFAYPFPSNATTTPIAFNGGLSGTLVGNASTATALQTGRTINGVTFDGTANIVILAASSTLLADSNTFSGTNTFSNPIVASVTGNAATVTNGVYTTTFNSLFDPRFITQLAATTSIASITTLPNLSLPYSQLTGTPSIAGYPFPLLGNATSTLTQFNGGLTAYASSTIGDGTAVGGLTISGNATTTGDAYFAGLVGVGTTSPYSTLSVFGTTTTTGIFNSDNAAGLLLSHLGSTTISVKGSRNFFAGFGANGSTTKVNASDNVFIGNQAGFAVNNSQNVYIGSLSGQGSTTGAANSGTGNTAVGYQTLQYNSTGSNNSAFGIAALPVNTTGSNNSAFGYQSLFVNTTGAANVSIGFSSLHANTSGNSNAALGVSALFSNTTGSSNVAIGTQALLFNTTGSNNSAFGMNALLFVNGGSNNTGLGSQAGYSVTTGYSNTLLGDDSTTNNTITTGFGNLGLGSNIFFPSATANRQLNIGNLLFGSLPATSTAFGLPTLGSLGVGTSSPFAKLSIQSNNGDTATTLFAIGSSTASATSTLFMVTNTGAVGIGTTSPYQALSVVGTTTSTGGFNVDGNRSLLSYLGSTTISVLGTNNFFAGLGANGSTTKATGTDNVFVGSQAGFAVTGSNNVYIGSGAGIGSTTGAANGGSLNTVVGNLSFRYNSTGSFNSSFGASALAFNTTGSYNNAFGNQSLLANTTGSRNNAFGVNALSANTRGSGNSAFGEESLKSNTTGTNNTAMGVKSGFSVTTGYSNLLLGDNNQAFPNTITIGGGNIGLGSNIYFPSDTANNQLNLGNLLFGTLPATSTAFNLPTSGALGVGTSSPFAKLSVQVNNGDTATTLFAIGSSTANSTSTLFMVTNTGAVGIGTTSPWLSLSVAGTMGLDGAPSTGGTLTLCLDNNKQVVTNDGACTSSTETVKRDMHALSIIGTTTLAQIVSSTYVYRNDVTGTTKYGFIAEQLDAIDPHFIDERNAQGNPLTIDTTSILSVVVKAVQEIMIQVGQLTASVSGFADLFTTKEAHIGEKLCVGSVCVSEEQFLRMVEASNVEPMSQPEPEPTPTPVVTEPEPVVEGSEPEPEPTPVVEVPETTSEPQAGPETEPAPTPEAPEAAQASE